MKTYVKKEQRHDSQEIKSHNYISTSTLTGNIKEGSKGKDYKLAQDYFTDTGADQRE